MSWSFEVQDWWIFCRLQYSVSLQRVFDVRVCVLQSFAASKQRQCQIRVLAFFSHLFCFLMADFPSRPSIELYFATF